MTIEHTFDWLFKRLQTPIFKPHSHDLECLTFIAEWVNREKEETLKKNRLFAKLYVRSFMYEMMFYKDLVISQKNLHKELSYPLELHYEIFFNRLNDVEYQNFAQSIGISEERFLSEFENDIEKLIFTENEKEMLKIIKGKWSKEKVTLALNNQITEAINNYKNLP